VKVDDELKKIVMVLKQLTEQALNEYSALVNKIILSETQDQMVIEHALDGLLDFCYDDNILILYKKLCRYYYYINPSATVFYVNAYREMWDRDSDKSDELE
jgi:hypothetical protein